ncbi:hypothetical protein ACFL59_10205 [Planctomycetota bacterium]
MTKIAYLLLPLIGAVLGTAVGLAVQPKAPRVERDEDRLAALEQRVEDLERTCKRLESLTNTLTPDRPAQTVALEKLQSGPAATVGGDNLERLRQRIAVLERDRGEFKKLVEAKLPDIAGMLKEAAQGAAREAVTSSASEAGGLHGISSTSGADKKVGLEVFDAARTPEETAAALLAFYKDRTRMGHSDPAIQRALEAGPDVVSPLLATLEEHDGMAEHAALRVIEKLAGPEHDEELLTAFRDHLDLAGIIRSRGLGELALPTLHNKMILNLEYYPEAFFDLLVDLRQVELYPYVLRFIEHGMNTQFAAGPMARAVEQGDAVDPAPAFMKALQRDADGWTKLQFGEALVRIGRVEGLPPLIALARQAEQDWLKTNGTRLLKKYVDYSGPEESFLDWLEGNAASLRWHAGSKKFVP